MDADLFDHVARTLTAATPRRALLGLLSGSALGIASLTDTGAKRKKKKGKKVAVCLNGQTLIVPKKKKSDYFGLGAFEGPCGPGEPPQPEPSCSDGVRNGNETDVDCGGSCERCGLNQACIRRQDCDSALCSNNVCVTCESDGQCGSDTSGPCRCAFSRACASNGGTVFVADTGDCPADTVAFVSIPGAGIRCHPRCGASFA